MTIVVDVSVMFAVNARNSKGSFNNYGVFYNKISTNAAVDLTRVGVINNARTQWEVTSVVALSATVSIQQLNIVKVSLFLFVPVLSNTKPKN